MSSISRLGLAAGEVTSARELLLQLTTSLHALAKHGRNDPWWFVPDPSLPTDRRAYLSVTVYRVKAPMLAASITMATHGSGTDPVAVVQFSAGSRTERLYVSVVPRGRERNTLGLPSLVDATPEVRDYWLKGMRRVRARGPRPGSGRWWIDERTPEHVTTLALLLFVNNSGVLPVEQGATAIQGATDGTNEREKGHNTPEWDLARHLINLTLKRQLDDGELFLVLGSGKSAKLNGLRRFALPSDWKGLPQYLRRVVATTAPMGRGHVRQGELFDDALMHERTEPPLAVPRRTYYRWIKEHGHGRARDVSDATREKLRKRAEEQALRRRAMTLLTERLGKSVEAARKYLQRQLQSGESLEAIVRELARTVG